MLKAIIIEDEYFFRESLIKTFPWDEFGVSVCGSADNGNEGIIILREQQPDFAFVDINMPGLNGLEFIKKGKCLSPDTKYIIISGYGEFSYAQEAISLGVIKYLLKPLRHEELKETLRELITNKICSNEKNEQIGAGCNDCYSVIVKKAIAYIQEYYQVQDLSVEYLSKELHLNYAYLCSVFKRDTNITINKYIKVYRLQRALELLENSDENISEIAWNVGFQSTNYFSKCFKKEYGISPSEYTETYRK